MPKPTSTSRSAAGGAPASWTIYSAFVQDSWRLTPTLTLNAGAALGRADAVRAVERHDDDGEPRRHLRRLGHRRRRHLQRLQLLRAARRAAARCRSSTQFTSGTRGYNTDWNNFAPNVGVAWRPNVKSGWLRALLGDPEQATIRGGYSVAYERQGIGGFTGIYGAEPRQHAEPDARRQHRPGRSRRDAGRCCCARPNRLYQRAVPDDADVPDRDPAEPRRQHQRVPPRHRGRVGAHRGRSASSARSPRTWRSRSATSARAASISGPTLNYNERNVIENGFLDEFKLAMANLQANNVAGGAAPDRSRTSGRARARTRCRSISPI